MSASELPSTEVEFQRADSEARQTPQISPEGNGASVSLHKVAGVVVAGVGALALPQEAKANSATGSITTSKVYVDVAHLDFGYLQRPITETYVVHITNITNPPVNVTLTSVSITSSEFHCLTATPLLIAPSATVSVTLQWAPSYGESEDSLSEDGIAYFYLDNATTTDVAITLVGTIPALPPTPPADDTPPPSSVDDGVWYTEYQSPPDPTTTTVGATDTPPPLPSDFTPPPTYYGE